MQLGEWNRQESACWNRLRTAIARAGFVQFVGAVEPQERGALHRHIVMFTDRPLAHEEVQEMALAAGYGCVLDLEPLESPAKAARYLSKYVTKSATGRADVPWMVQAVDARTGEVDQVTKRPTYRLWSSSRRWGVTMKQIRAHQAAQSRQRALYLRELAELLDEPAVSTSVGTDRQGLDPP